MKRFLVLELTDQMLDILLAGKRITGSIGLMDDGEIVDFHRHYRSNAPRPKRKRIDIPCAGGVMTLYIPDTLLN